MNSQPTQDTSFQALSKFPRWMAVPTLLATLCLPSLGDGEKGEEKGGSSKAPLSEVEKPVVGEASQRLKESLPVREVEWGRFRDYVNAYAWVADIDFRDGEVKGLHVCIGFNGFREAEALSALGFQEGENPDTYIRLGAFVAVWNAEGFTETVLSHLTEILASEDYASSSGADRLAYVRAELWDRVSRDKKIDIAIQESLNVFASLSYQLHAAGLIKGEGLPENPVDYISGFNVIFMNRKSTQALLADPAFRAIESPESRRKFFTEQLVESAILDANIEDAEQARQYGKSLKASLQKMFEAGGSYIVVATE